MKPTSHTRQSKGIVFAPPSGPVGDRPPPRPDKPLICIRVAFVALLISVFFQPGLTSWAVGQPHPDTQINDPVVRVGVMVAWGIRQMYAPPWWLMIMGGALIGSVVLVGELAWNAGLWVVQSWYMTRAGYAYVRIRIPRPSAGQTRMSGAVTQGEDLFRALHRLLSPYGSQRGTAPWLAWTMGAHPDESVTLGAVMGGGTASLRERWIGTLRKVCSGFDASAVVDQVADPLKNALTPGAVVCWRIFTLFHPPSYPVRLPDDAMTDLMGPLLAAVRSRPGIRYTECAISVRPRHDWDLTNGWRVYALRRLLLLRARHQYALTPDIAALQNKIDSPSFDATIRFVVVARYADTQAAELELAELTAILASQYQARSGTRLQRFCMTGRGSVVVPTRAEPQTFRQWVLRLWTVALGGVLGGLLGWALIGVWGHVWIAVFFHGADLPSWCSRGLAHMGLSWCADWGRPLPLLIGLTLSGAVLLGIYVVQCAWGIPRWQRIALLCRRPPRPMPFHPIMLPIRAWRPPAILSGAELGGLWHLPIGAMGALVQWLPCRVFPTPPFAFVETSPSTTASVNHPRWWDRILRWRWGRSSPNPQHDATVLPPNPRIVVGLATRSDGSFAPVGLPLFNLRQIMHLTAGMGAGKSRLLANICQQLLPYGFLLADGKGDDAAGSLVATVRQLLPRAVEERVMILDILDTDWPFGINPLSGIDLERPGGADMALGQILAIFSRLDPDTWGKAPGMQQYVRMGALLVFEAQHAPTMAHIKQVLIDESYRIRLLGRCTNVEVKTFWSTTFPAMVEQHKMSLDALLRRFDNLLATETTRYLLTQPLTVDMRLAMDMGTIVLMPMPDLTLGGMAGLVGMLLIQSLVRAASQRGGSDQTRTTYTCIIDELQVFVQNDAALDDVATAITRLRAYGIGGIYAHQALMQLGDLQDVMQTNAQSQMILKTSEPDASVYAKRYAGSGITAVDIANQDAGEHQYAVLQCGSQNTGPISVRPLPWPEPIQEETPLYTGPDWKTQLPREIQGADALIVQLVYGVYAPLHIQRIVLGLSQLDESTWRYLVARWDVIRAFQRAFILQHPGCIPNRLDRQRWLSRLWVQQPRILVAAAYQRQRWMVNPQEPPTRVRALGSGRGGRSGFPRRDGHGTPPVCIPGLAPVVPPPPPLLATGESLETLIRERGRRRATDTIPHDQLTDLPEE